MAAVTNTRNRQCVCGGWGGGALTILISTFESFFLLLTRQAIQSAPPFVVLIMNTQYPQVEVDYAINKSRGDHERLGQKKLKKIRFEFRWVAYRLHLRSVVKLYN